MECKLLFKRKCLFEKSFLGKKQIQMQQHGAEFCEAVGKLPPSLRTTVAAFLMEEYREITLLNQFGSRSRGVKTPQSLLELHKKFYQTLQILTQEYTSAIKTAIAELPD